MSSCSSSSPSVAAQLSDGLTVQYPVTNRIPVVDNYHGTELTDHYRWLEDPDSAETSAWVQQQNQLTDSYLTTCTYRDSLKSRLQQVYNYERYTCPFRRGQRYFYFHNSGLQNQNVLYKQEALDGKAEILLDPNQLATDGTASLGTYAFSESGKYLAYGVSRSGSDWQTIQIMTVDDNKQLEEKLEWIKFSSIAWTHDDTGFFYSRYPTPPEFENKDDSDYKRGTETSAAQSQSLYYHKLGTNQSDDILVYRNEQEPKWMVSAEVTDDGQYVLITINDSCDPVNRLFYFHLHEKAFSFTNANEINIIKLIDNFESEYSYVTNEDSVFYFKTNRNAPTYKIISIDFTNPLETNWKEIIPTKTDVLNYVVAVNKNQLITCYMHDVQEILQLYHLDGTLIKELFPLPAPGSIVGLSARKQDSTFFYNFSSFTYPGTIYSVDLSNDTTNIFRETKIDGFDASLFKTEQVRYKSKDGTEVPMFVVMKKDTVLDGNNVTLLYGYGGFNISLTPTFNVSRVVFMQHFNGIFACANIRGGGEYGEQWHQAGTKARKQNVFDDFIGAAEYLISNQYTSPNKLAINGGSNGGLLVCAVANQRPELFAAVIAQVGVLDMLRFHRFTIGYAWVSDYGSADNKEDFEYLIKYSPVHNVTSRPYPAMLVCTSDHDDRVVPLHSYKYIAELQHQLAGQEWQKNPLIIRIETKAGHGAGLPLSKRIAEIADVYGFIAKVTKTEGNF